MGDELPFRVELWDDRWARRLEVLVRATDFRTAKAAYETAVQNLPGEAILFCDRARIILRAREW